jgi:hypothetical protein
MTASPISSTPKSVPATTTKEQPALSKKTPQFQPVKHPLRFCISGRQHMIQPLKDLISADANIPDHFKAVLSAEIDNIKTNAAQVDLHVVDHADGGISFQGHIKPIQLG